MCCWIVSLGWLVVGLYRSTSLVVMLFDCFVRLARLLSRWTVSLSLTVSLSFYQT